MGTRSTIALEFADGTVQQVYCHWDGYLEHNGKILLENYSNPFILRDLIDLGDMSKLGKNIGVKHPFGNPYRYGTPEYENHEHMHKDMCTFYGRDRGETNINARKFKDFEDYRINGDFQEYDYILTRDHGWLVMSYSTNTEFVPLNIELLKMESSEEE